VSLWSVLALGPWLLLFLVPVLSLLGGDWSAAQFLDPLVLAKVRATVEQAGVSAAISGALGLVWGGLLRGYPRAQRWLRVPFGVPTLAAVAAWSFLLRKTGLEYSLGAVILAHVVFNVPWVALAVAQAAAGVPRVWDESARSLGAGFAARVRSVWWPVIAPAWFGAVTQVFSFCASSFVIVLILGGGPPVETLETAIYSSVRSGSLDLGQAMVLAIWQMGLSLGPWLWVRRRFASIRLRPTQLEAHAGRWNHFFASCFAALWILPYGAFLLNLGPEILERDFWASLGAPLFFSIGIAVFSSAIAVLWSGASVILLQGAGSRAAAWLEMFLLLPSGLSTLTLCMGFWLAYAQFVDPFEGSLAALIAIQATVFFTIVLRSFIPLAQARPRALWEMARSHGASPWRAFLDVEWPRWRAPVWSALVMVCAASLSEVAAVGFFGSERIQTASGLISRWMGSYRFEQANALTAILLAASVILSLVGASTRAKREIFGR